MSTTLRALAAALLAGAAGLAGAKLVEQQLDLPVQVTDAYGKLIEQPIKVTLFFDDAKPAPRPLLVLNHGRAPEAVGRAALGRARYPDNARWFASNGFAVAVPTRIGYGVTAGPDVEDTGPCQKKSYPPGYAAAVQQVVAVLAALRQRPDIAPANSVVAGQSFGGAAAIGVAASNTPGVVAAINFAGGGGGNPKTQPGRPCAPHLLERMFAAYGATTTLPTLWIYTENDLYLGAQAPRDWYAAFRRAGGRGEFTQFPPNGDDGHSLFTHAPATWRPVVAEFLRRQGFEVTE